MQVISNVNISIYLCRLTLPATIAAASPVLESRSGDSTGPAESVTHLNSELHISITRQFIGIQLEWTNKQK